MSNQREHRESASPAIAVVGVSALFPGSTDVRGFWRTIVEGQNQIKEVPPNYWLLEDYYDPNPAAPDKTYGKTGAFLDAVPFDALGYGVPPNVVQQTDTSQLLGLIVAQQVLEDAAGGDFQHIDKSRISVILGATGATERVVHLGSRLQRPIWLNARRANGVPEDEAQAICDRIADSYVPWTEASFPGLLGNVVAGRIANKFDLGGTNCVVDAACASSLSTLAMGLSELYLRQSDMVIVGGVDTLNDILMYMCFSKTPALSATGDCRPFSDQADGTILGEGLGMLALRRLEDAERDGDRIYAVIRGIGASSDGKGTAVYAPKANGQAHALRRAYAAAGYSPRTVELLEAHGTATKAGDVAEFGGASSVFAEADAESRQWCAIGSVKSQIGHTKGAAGAASLIKAVLALHHKVLPPTIKVERPNPNLAVAETGVTGNGRAASNGPVTRVAPSAERTVQPTAPVLLPVTPPALPHPPDAPDAVRPAPAPQTVPAPSQATPPPVTVQAAPAPAAAPTAAPPSILAASAGESLAWVQAFQHLQQQTADAHVAFLRVAEQSMRSLEAMLSGARGEGRKASALRVDPNVTIVNSLTTGDEVLDPAVDTWLQDHCPTWTVPALAMMSMVDRLVAGAQVRAPGRRVVGLRNVRVHRWLSFAGGAQRVKTLGRPVGSDTVTMQLLVWEEAQRRFALVASGDVILTEHWQLAGRPWEPLAAGQPEPNPYAAGVLFPGPAYQLLTELQISDNGADSWLDLDASGVPVGTLNQGLLDAATHGIPHDALWRWSAEILADVAAYPVAITGAHFYGPTPVGGRVRCAARFAGFQGDDRRFPMIRVQIITDDEVWAEFELVETLFAKGPLGQAEPAARRAFLHEQRFVPGMALSSHTDGVTKVSDATVKGSDRLAGIVAALYAPELAGTPVNTEQLSQLVAIKEHVALRWQIHPARLAITDAETLLTQRRGDTEKDGEAKALVVTSPLLPPNRAQVVAWREGDAWRVTDAGDGAGLDLSAVQRFWRERANASGTLVEDLTLALMQRFVRQVEIADPAGYAALHGRGVLYLANHQLDLESVLFVSMIAALQDTVTTAIARQELGESWVGPYFDICFQHPQLVDPHMLLLIDRASPEAVFQALSDAVERTRTAHNSLLVHVEGKHAAAARQPVEVVSTALIDLAVGKNTPIVPVRFAGGLPVTPVAAPRAFPVAYGQQDFLIGAPLLPGELAPLSSAERRVRVLAALNGFDDRWMTETPNPGDAAFAAAVAAWQQTHGVTAVQAVLYQTLAAVPKPGAETQWLLDRVQGKRRKGQSPADDVKRWLALVASQLLGVSI